MRKALRILFLITLFGLVICFYPTKFSKDQLYKINTNAKSASISNKEYAVLIDYSKPVFRKRLWLIRLKDQKVLLNCHVSHAMNSGFLCASKFSNEIGSEYSCTGKFKTMNAYESSYGKGKYKIGLRLKGLDSDNSNTMVRNIVFHTSFPIWSKGCFMTTSKNNKFIVDKMKKGSLVLVLR